MSFGMNGHLKGPGIIVLEKIDLKFFMGFKKD